MRNIRKKFKIQTVEVLAYNKVKKVEETLEVKTIEGLEEIKLPSEYVPLDSRVIETEEATYKMSPLEFIEHGEVVE